MYCHFFHTFTEYRKLIEMMGPGIPRMIQYSKEHDIEVPIFEIKDQIVKVSFPNIYHLRAENLHQGGTVKKRLIGQLIILPAILLMVVVTGCSERQEHRDALHRALSLMDNHPDSALSVLDSLGKHKADFGHHFSMQYRLHRLNAYNKLDTLFHSTDEARALADYFQDSGTPNEQMLANYLLGRAYYDLHEAPMSLHYFQKASECADTIDDDCNYRLLSRVYGQMGYLFYYQNN